MRVRVAWIVVVALTSAVLGVAGLAVSRAADALAPIAQPAMEIEGATRLLADRGPTYMYRGHTEIGEVLDGNVDCDYSGAFAKINERKTWIVLQQALSGTFGHARLVRPGRWAIYETAQGLGLVGFATRRTPRRWNVFKKGSGRLFGYTLGPEGPQAATALLLIC